jgi:hypothetical protein
MDEAFVPFSRILEGMVGVGPEWTDAEAGVRTYVTGWEIEAPVELDVSRDAEGRLRVGTTPPLYPLRTSIAPSFHRLRFRATRSEEPDGGF